MITGVILSFIKIPFGQIYFGIYEPEYKKIILFEAVLGAENSDVKIKLAAFS